MLTLTMTLKDFWRFGGLNPRHDAIELSVETLPPVLNATQVSEVLGISRAGAYNLMHREDFPTLLIGKRMLVPKDKLLAWINRNTGGDVA